jgi:DNA-binding winged helix-turn-helix (wHTH) protein/Tfp pilus assembly protein PilF
MSASESRRFGTFTLDAGQRLLTKEGVPVRLPPKAIDLLLVLVESAGRFVSKEELLRRVWAESFVEEGNLSKLIFLLRRELGDAPDGKPWIETLPKRGYRFVPPVVESAAAPRPGATSRPGGAPVVPAVDPEAWQLYLQGRYLWNRRPGPVVFEALDAFRRAVERDPRFALAWAGIADVYSILGSWESGVLPHGEAQAKAREHAARAIALDPGLAEAHTTLAYVALHHDRDLEVAERGLRHALALGGSYAPAHHWYAHVLVAARRWDEALAESRAALAAEPMNLILHAHLAWHHQMTRSPAETVEQARRVIRMDANFHWGHFFLGWGLEAAGEPAAAVAAMSEAVRTSGDEPVMRAGLGRALAVDGEARAARAIARELERPAGEPQLFAYELALIELALGESESSWRWLARAVAERSSWLAYLDVDPRLDPLRADARFARLAKRAH